MRITAGLAPARYPSRISIIKCHTEIPQRETGTCDRASPNLSRSGTLGARPGRIRGRGYVDETEAAWELVTEAVDSFRADLRRTELDLTDAAATLARPRLSESLRPEDSGSRPPEIRPSPIGRA